MRVNLSSMPSPKRLLTVDLSNLNGGLNLWDVPYRVEANQSPDMKNLLWSEGALGSRRGQVYLNTALTGVGYTMFPDLYADKLVAHIGSGLYAVDPETGEAAAIPVKDGDTENALLPENRGTFFRYGENLYYKNRGAYVEITSELIARPVTGYTPVVLVNADPLTGAGSMYQPENRIQAAKTVWYNAATTSRTTTSKADGSKTVFEVGYTIATHLSSVDRVYIGTTQVSTSFYTVDLTAGTVTFTFAPENNESVTINFSLGVTEYQLPIKDLDSLDRVEVDGKELTVALDYTVNLETGVLTFIKAPPVTVPASNNTVRVTLSKENADARQAIMDCRYAVNFGGDQNMCVVLGGATKQRNAYFWNGNTAAGMDPSYFPVDFYNLAGATEDPVTGFGKQQSYLIVFTTKSVGKVQFGTSMIDDRTVIAMPYTPVNDRIGCDLPWTIQLVENNLVFCNTDSGVHYLTNTTSANENNVLNISRNINGSDTRPGLLRDARAVGEDNVCSVDDGKRYWVVANGHAYLWDYQINGSPNYPEKLSWFYFTRIAGIAFATNQEDIYHLAPDGKLTAFQSEYSDYGEPIGQSFEFAVQILGGYHTLKDVTKVILSVRSDTNSTLNIVYETDYGSYTEPTPIRAWHWKLSPRNLSFRSLAEIPFAHVAVRKPGCRHIRHFSMRIYNNNNYEDMSILSAQVFYTQQGRDR